MEHVDLNVRAATVALVVAAAASGVAQRLIAQQAEGYTVEQFLGVTMFREVTASPDGRHVAFISATDDFVKDREDIAVWRLDVDEGGRRTALTRLTWEPGDYSDLQWSPDARRLSFLVERADVEAQLRVMSVLGGEARALTDTLQFHGGIAAYDWAPDGKSIVLAVEAEEDSGGREAKRVFYGDAIRLAGEVPRGALYRVAVSELEAGRASLIATLPFPVAELRHSPDGRRLALRNVEAATGYSDSFADVEVYVMPATGHEPPKKLAPNFVIEDGIEWMHDGRRIYSGGFGDERAERDVMTNSRMYRVAVDGHKWENVLPGFEGSVEEFEVLPNGSLLASAVVSTTQNLYRIDPIGQTVTRVTDYHGRAMQLSVSLNGRLVAYVVSDNRSFPELYVAPGEGALGKAARVTSLNAAIESLPKPEVETIRWTNGEGDTVEGVLYWPPGRRGAKNLPFVQRMHGGPWLASTEALITSTSRFMYYAPLLATRGYLVLETNYRGSTGRGDDFLHAIEGYGCSRPAVDILTGVDYVIEKGWVDSTRMGVSGWSYGGILTNCLIGRTTRFQAAASGAGDWNETSAFGTGDTFYWYHVMNGGKPPWENLEQYWTESGISTSGRVRTPTIFTHGDADRIVPTSQGYEGYRSLVWLGVPTELLIFPDEGHVFRKPSHKRTKVMAELAWFDKYLLGKTSERK